MTIPSAIAEAIDRIDRARQAAGRSDRVALELAVKTRTPEECREAAQALSDLGQPILLGHNRVQEATATVAAIRQVPGAQIHLIGPLQSNRSIRPWPASTQLNRLILPHSSRKSIHA